MSCIACDKESGKVYAFVKGSPEKIFELSNKSSLPEDYMEKMENLAVKGLRIIAMGYRELEDFNL